MTSAREFLNSQTRESDENLRVEPTDDGVIIELLQQPDQLKFRHSYVETAFFKRAQQARQALLKACNNRQRSIHSILDLTGGWGMDSFILAHHGQRVTMIEYDRLVYSVCRHSLECARLIRRSATAASRIETIHANAFQFLQALDENTNFDCIYLDPMFPAHHSSAKPAKEMQILQYLTSNEKIEECFDLALLKAAHRVVVKRPAKAPPLTERSPDLEFREKTIRFDVYLTKES